MTERNNHPNARFPHKLGVTVTIGEVMARWGVSKSFLEAVAKRPDQMGELPPFRNGGSGIYDEKRKGWLFPAAGAKSNYGLVAGVEEFDHLPDDAYYYLPWVLAFEEDNPQVKPSTARPKRKAMSEKTPADDSLPSERERENLLRTIGALLLILQEARPDMKSARAVVLEINRTLEKLGASTEGQSKTTLTPKLVMALKIAREDAE